MLWLTRLLFRRRPQPAPGPARKPCPIHADGHLYDCPVTAWRPPPGR